MNATHIDHPGLGATLAGNSARQNNPQPEPLHPTFPEHGPPLGAIAQGGQTTTLMLLQALEPFGSCLVFCTPAPPTFFQRMIRAVEHRPGSVHVPSPGTILLFDTSKYLIPWRKSHVEESCRTPQESIRTSYACRQPPRRSGQASRRRTPRKGGTSCPHRERPRDSRKKAR
jgi:hypothetical protein